MQVPPDPVFRLGADVFGQQAGSVSQGLGYVVGASILALVLWVSLFAVNLEVGLFRLLLDFEQKALVSLDEGIVVTDEHTFFFHIHVPSSLSSCSSMKVQISLYSMISSTPVASVTDLNRTRAGSCSNWPS